MLDKLLPPPGEGIEDEIAVGKFYATVLIQVNKNCKNDIFKLTYLVIMIKFNQNNNCIAFSIFLLGLFSTICEKEIRDGLYGKVKRGNGKYRLITSRPEDTA